MIPEYGGERPADQCQIVRRVEMWYTSKDIGPFSTCILHTNLKTRFEYGISHLVCLACYYHTSGTKSLRRLRNLSNKHKLSDRNVKRVMSRDCHVINYRPKMNLNMPLNHHHHKNKIKSIHTIHVQYCRIYSIRTNGVDSLT